MRIHNRKEDEHRKYAKGDISPVPEPTTMLLLGLGLMGLAWVQRFMK